MMKERLLAVALTAAVLSTVVGCGHTKLKTYPSSEHFRNFLTLSIGDPAPDFQLRDIHGSAWRLSDSKGKVIALQFASATSPAFVSGLDDFQREVLSKYYMNPDILFVYVFSSEAHPELLSHEERRQIDRDKEQHRLKAASRYYYTLKFKDHGKFHVTGMIPAAQNVVILVDAPDDTVGNTYGYGRGGVTNPAFLIDKQGRVVAKALRVSDFLSPSGFVAGNLPMLAQSELE